MDALKLIAQVHHLSQLVACRTGDVEETLAIVHNLVAVRAAELEAQVEAPEREAFLCRKYIREIVLSLHWENVDTYIAMCYHKLIEESK